MLRFQVRCKRPVLTARAPERHDIGALWLRYGLARHGIFEPFSYFGGRFTQEIVSYNARLATAGARGPEITIGIRGDNLLNEDVRNSASFKKDEVLAPGASVRVFGSFKFN